MNGEYGPEIHYWFLPFSVYHTNKRCGLNWLISRGPREPVYQGRRLSQWIDVFFRGFSGKSNNPNREESDAVEAAIRAIGTNAIPEFLFWLSDGAPGANRRGNAELGFKFLGEVGRPATGELIKLTKNSDADIRLRALMCLVDIKAESEFLVQTLKSLTNDPCPPLRDIAFEKLMELNELAVKANGPSNSLSEFNDYTQTNNTINKQ
jgi:hypothetical protein